MNKADRQIITEAMIHLGDAQGFIERLKEEKQEIFDEMSEGAQEGARGEALSELIASLEEAMDNAESAFATLEGID